MKMKITLLISLSFLCLATKAQTYQWAKKIAGSDIDQINTMTTDKQGNVYVAGSFRGSMDADPGPGITILTSSGNQNSDIFFAKYDSAGNYLWAKSLSGDTSIYTNEEATSIDVDAKGYVYISGTFTSFVDFNPGAGTATLTQAYQPSSQNLFVAKYDASGNYIWAKNFGQKSYLGDKVLMKIDDTSSYIYLSGYFAGTADFDPNAGVANLTAKGYEDIYIAKYDNSGNYIWAKNIGGATSRAKTFAITKNSQGNIIIAGYFDNFVDFDPSVANAVLNGGSGNSFFAEYDPSGNYVSAKSFEGSYNKIFDIAVGPSNTIYVAGTLRGTADFDPSIASAELSSTNMLSDNFFAKYDAAGNYLFAKLLPGSANNSDVIPSIGIDNFSNIYVSGNFNGSGDFDPGVGISILGTVNSNYGTFYAKYDSLGNYLWANKIVSVGGVTATTSKINSLNELYIAGTYGGTCDFDPGVPVSNLLNSGSTDGFLAKYTSGSPLGINDFTLFPKDISIFPNPSHDSVSIQSKEKLKSIKCTNYLGQNMDLNLENNALNISSLSAGVYFLNILSEDGKTTLKKFVKE